MEKLSPEQVLWLKENNKFFEFILVHRILNDEAFRGRCMGKVGSVDFDGKALSAIYGGILYALKVIDGMDGNYTFPIPLPPGWLESYLHAANVNDSLFKEEEFGDIQQAMTALQDVGNREHWYFIDQFFPTWLEDSKSLQLISASRAADFVDAGKLAAKLTEAATDAKAVIFDAKNNAWHDTLYGDETDPIPRYKMGIAPLDDATNGIAPGEAFLVFAGTGGGKTVSVAQSAGYRINLSSPTLILTTEVTPPKYVARILSSRCRINIKGLSSCPNVKSMMQYIAINHEDKLDSAEKVVQQIKQFLYIKKVDPEDGMDSMSLLRTSVRECEEMIGQKPEVAYFDWIGSVADNGAGSGSSERAADWERSANQAVKAAEIDNVAWIILAQAVNNAQLMTSLTINDIGISKGMGKNMVAVIGITNAVDKEQLAKDLAEGGSSPTSMIKKDQRLCVCKAREGETHSIPIRTEYQYQRMIHQVGGY